MAESKKPVSLSQARERAIEELSRQFGNDALTMEELESRLESVYRARTVGEVEALTGPGAGLPAAPRAPAPARRSFAVELPAEHERILAFLSTARRKGAWTVARRLQAAAILGELKLDFTQATLPPGTIELELKAFMGAVRITLPPGVRVLNRAMVALGEFSDDTEDEPIAPGDTIIRVTGSVVLAEVKVRSGR